MYSDEICNVQAKLLGNKNAYDELVFRHIVKQSKRADFFFPLEETTIATGFVERNTVGVNVSPMIIGYEKKQGVTLQNYVNLIQNIIDNTDIQVALIPHVVWRHNDDREPLRCLFDLFKETGRVVMIEDHNA